ncbi:hypothetical protein BGZ63DRAFT_463147 [Mariannaea sp. PMI_226]|nr:hypothetical protein BGZ63DRAFT_463147 [Mariannaea sp. PMI_226]
MQLPRLIYKMATFERLSNLRCSNSLNTSENEIPRDITTSQQLSECQWYLPSGILDSPAWTPAESCYTDMQSTLKSPAMPTTLYAELSCVACGCYLCGKQLYNCAAPKNQYPYTGLQAEGNYGITIIEPSCMMVLLPFSSQQAMQNCWQSFRSSIKVHTDVWFSRECQAGQPQTKPIEYDFSVGTGRSWHRPHRGQRDCCILLVLHGYHLNPGRWNSAGLMGLLCTLLGLQCRTRFEAAMSIVTHRVTCELVPLSHVKSWYECRKDVLEAFCNCCTGPQAIVAYGTYIDGKSF